MNQHLEDWATLLRAPALGTVVDWAIWLLIAGPVMVPAVLTFLWVPGNGSPRKPRPILWTFGGLLLLITAWSFASGVETRLMQARCWSGGPANVPIYWRERCERIPPQNVRGLYWDHWLLGRHAYP